MKLLGYGEDSVTLWAVNNKLDVILKQLNDNTNSKECIVFYRPSFGRGIGSSFGEFDVFIITSKTAYLVESKWDGSNASYPNDILKLTHNQTRRHEIFKWYNDNWKGEGWEEFVSKCSKQFKDRFNKSIASVGSLLSHNLITILEKTKGKDCVNVLLFLYRHEENIPDIQTEFKIVKIKYRPIGEYVEL